MILKYCSCAPAASFIGKCVGSFPRQAAFSRNRLMSEEPVVVFDQQYALTLSSFLGSDQETGFKLVMILATSSWCFFSFAVVTQ